MDRNRAIEIGVTCAKVAGYRELRDFGVELQELIA